MAAQLSAGHKIIQRLHEAVPHEKLVEIHAMLDVLTLKQIVKLKLNRLFSGSASTGSLKKTSNILNESINKMIKERSDRLRKFSSPELAKKIWRLMCQRAGLEKEVQNIDRAGRLMLEKIAWEYGVNPRGLSDDILFERVMNSVLEQIITDLSKTMKILTPEQEKELLEVLGDAINNLSENDKVTLSKVLNLNEISSQAVIAALKSGALTSGTIFIASSTGFGIYMFFSTMLHAIFTQLLGITLPFTAYIFTSTAISWLLGPLAPILVAIVGTQVFNKYERKFSLKILGLVLWEILAA